MNEDEMGGNPCETCGEVNTADTPCGCWAWTSANDLAFADFKAYFADHGVSVTKSSLTVDEWLAANTCGEPLEGSRSCALSKGHASSVSHWSEEA